MNRNLLRWIIAFVILIAVLVALLPLKRYVGAAPLSPLLVAVIATIALIFARRYLRRFPAGRGTWRVSQKQYVWSNILAVIGGILVVAAFCWIAIGVRMVPDTNLGAAALFIPSLLSMTLGILFLAIRVAIWVFGIPRQDTEIP
ncbi:MAG: hypothetical protein ABSD74_03665 [Rhizomicrobium sp.]|jgi:hypothetical protein